MSGPADDGLTHDQPRSLFRHTDDQAGAASETDAGTGRAVDDMDEDELQAVLQMTDRTETEARWRPRARACSWPGHWRPPR